MLVKFYKRTEILMLKKKDGYSPNIDKEIEESLDYI